MTEVKFKGKNYNLLENAHPDQSGNEEYFVALGEDDNGNQVKVRWEFTDEYLRYAEIFRILSQKEILINVEEHVLFEAECYVETSENCCDWEFPSKVWEV